MSRGEGYRPDDTREKLLSAALEEHRLRKVMETYLHGLDLREESLVAECFTDDAIAIHHKGSDTEFEMIGSANIAKTLIDFLLKFESSIHTICTQRIVVEENTASVSTFAVANVVGNGRVRVRGIHYADTLVKCSRWLISKRTHTQLWQIDADASKPFLPR